MDWKPFRSRSSIVLTTILITIFCTISISLGSESSFSLRELTTTHFPRLISNDIYLDPCKSGELISITLTSD